MRGPSAYLKGIICACGLAVAGIGHADPVRISVDAAPAAISLLLQSKQPAAAREIARAALQARPNDPVILLLLAKANVDLRRPDRAIDLVKTVQGLGTNDANLFHAARIRAEAHAQLEQFTRAQFWLRRASNYTQDRAALGSVTQAHRLVRQTNPLSTSLRFGATPSNNINNGSSGDHFAIGQFVADHGIDGGLLTIPIDAVIDIQGTDDAQLSGLALNLGGSVQYRLDRTETAASFLTAAIDYRSYILSDEAQQIAPDASGRDYENGTAMIGFARRQIFDGNDRPMTLQLNVGQTWFAGAAYSRFIEASFVQSYKINPTDNIWVNGYVKNRTIIDTDAKARTTGVRLNWAHKFDNDDSLRLGLHARRSQSDRFDDDFTAYDVDVDYSFGAPVAGMKFAVGAGWGETFHDRSNYAPGLGSRHGAQYELRGSVQFTQIDYFGFQPVVRLERSVTHSTVDLFDRNNISLGLSFQSSF